jgi:hypothetical protein
MTIDTASNAPADLQATIRQNRERTHAYLVSACSRRRHLLNVALIAGVLAAFLTAAPALGGKSFADWITSTIGLSSPAWQLLCSAAAGCSLTATIATQTLKSHNLDERISNAQTVNAHLEALEIRIRLHNIDHAEAVAELIKCVDEGAFMGHSPHPRDARRQKAARRTESAPSEIEAWKWPIGHDGSRQSPSRRPSS